MFGCKGREGGWAEVRFSLKHLSLQFIDIRDQFQLNFQNISIKQRHNLFSQPNRSVSADQYGLGGLEAFQSAVQQQQEAGISACEGVTSS